MRRRFRPWLLVLVALPPVTSTLLAQSDRPARGWFRCDTNTGGETIYATPFFDWTGTFDQLQNAFQQHLLAKYGYKDRVSCSMATPGGNTLANLQADMQRQYAQFRAQGKKIVELPWTITSAGVTLAYQCFGVARVRRAATDSTYLLHSKVVRIQVGNVAELATSWIDELKRLHPGWFFTSPGCNLLPADPAKYQAFLDSMVGMYASTKPKVTQLDWEYQPGAAALTEAEDKKPAYYCERISGTSKTVFLTPVRPADPAWERMDYQYAWQKYVQGNLDKDAFTGGCEAGTMKQETVARNGRREQWVNQGYTIRDVDWSYAPGARPISPTTPAPTPAAAPAPTAAPPATPPAPGAFPSVDRFGRPLPKLTFYCQYLGLAHDASGKYPLYRNELFAMATMQGAVQNAWKEYIEATYKPTSPGNPMCAIVPADPAQREAVMNSFNLLTQPATQKVVKVAWKP